MERHFDRDLEKIREKIIAMGTLVEEAVQHAITAFLKRDLSLAQEVITRDTEINMHEMEIDRLVLEMFALHQPVAADLRFLLAVGKINKDLERIGDHAVNIAQSATNYISLTETMIAQKLSIMVGITVKMLHDALTSFIDRNSQLSLMVLEQDDQVDDLNSALTRDMIDMVKKDVTTIEAALELIRISKNLERIADLSTNICEDVIFHAKALDVKHQKLRAPEVSGE